MIVCGIDPGITGAIAFYDTIDQAIVDVFDMPTITDAGRGKKQRLNVPEIASMLRSSFVGLVRVEQVASRPGQGVASTFNFGRGYGNLEAVVQTLGIPIAYVTPNTWKKAAGLIGSDKDAARGRALQDFPDLDLSKKKHIGRADAILIAKYGDP